MSEGFELGRSLAVKAHYLFQHMRDTTLTDHYDWGLRAYKASVTHAGNFLRGKSDITPDTEHVALLSSIKQNFESMLTTKDVANWFGILE